MRMFRRVVLILAAVIIILVAIGFLLPQRVTVARSIAVDAPPEVVFPLVGDLRQVGKWSPWLGVDPNIRVSFSGAETGVGQVMSWTSNDPRVGEGSQTVTEYVPNSRVITALDFGAQGNAVATTTVEPSGAGSQVTWEFETDLGMNPVARYFGLALERMIAPDFESGLAALKRVAEAETTTPAESAPGSGNPSGPSGTTSTSSPGSAPATPQAGGVGTGASDSSGGTGTAPSPSPDASSGAPTTSPGASNSTPGQAPGVSSAAPTTAPQSSTAPSATTNPSTGTESSMPQSSQSPIAPQTITPTPPPAPSTPAPVAPLTPPPPDSGAPAPVVP